ncbi:barstar family protein [Ferribacterium limneticum]|uniref:barstar family protein n=1 Tax=Ferribacterium limneticum TaxID=76259 RepID=UPI001CF99C25|nr:barstar family protein [Ferribacterium limneticum]UCV29167.1 barstar family protein [Ferribacterium limneticum]UCV33086.1 barstar family protein [Ferribacterium limneticum]
MNDNLLKNADASGVCYLSASRQSAVEAAASRARFCVLTAGITTPSSIEDVLAELGSAFKFPIWYGANLDALCDCLADPDWQPAKGHVLLINGIANLRAADPDGFATLIEVLQTAAEIRRNSHTPFWIFIDAPARGVPALPEA